jgi:hypothetical protein
MMSPSLFRVHPFGFGLLTKRRTADERPLAIWCDEARCSHAKKMIRLKYARGVDLLLSNQIGIEQLSYRLHNDVAILNHKSTMRTVIDR